MRNIYKIPGIALAIMTLAPVASHAYTRVSDPLTDLPDGAIITLQSPSATGGSYYFFNGAASKTAPAGDAMDPTYANFYVAHRLADTDGKATITLKRISDGTYIGRSGETIVTTSTAEFVLSCPKTLHTNETLSLEDMVSDLEEEHLIRLTHKGSNYKLNIQGASSNPAFKTGNGGWSAWYINVYTSEEILALMPWLSDSNTIVATSNDKSITFPDNTIVSLQCLDTNGGSFYYFNGKTTKNPHLSTENLYKICATGTDAKTFHLQRISDNKYIGKNNGVTLADNESGATIFTAAITSADNWTTKATGITNDDNGKMTVRFTVNENGSNTSNILNANARGGIPTYATGHGGYSIWGVKIYPYELAMLMKKEEVAANVSESWRRVVPAKELEAIDNAIATTAKTTVTYGGNIHDTFNEIDNSYDNVRSNVYSIVDGLLVTINNVRRGGDTPNYLYATDADNHMINTHSTIDESSKWAIIHPEGAPYFHLFNPAARGYIKQMEHNTHTPFTTEITEAGRYDLIPHPAVHNDESTGIMVKKHGENMALNVDTGTSPLVFWNDMTDAGSEWLASLAETPVDEISSDGNYYRVRSHYGLNNGEGSFVAVNTVLGDDATEGDAQSLKLTTETANIGTLWQLSADGKLENVATDFIGHDRYGLTAEGNVGEASVTADVNAHDNSTFACSISLEGGNLAINNDETFYFEAVPAEEAQTIINDYIALSTQATQDEINNLKNSPILWDADKVTAAETAATEAASGMSVKSANSAELLPALAEVYNSVIGKRFHFANRHNDNNGHHLYVNNGHLQSSATASYDVRTVWEIIGTDNPGEYILYNYHDQTYAGFNESDSGIIPASTEGEIFRLEYPEEHWSEYDILTDEIVLHAITGTGSDHDSHYICDATNSDQSENTSVTSFRRPHPGSHWIVSPASKGDTVTVNYDTYGNITFSNPDGKDVIPNEYCNLPAIHYTIPASEESTFLAAPRRAEEAESGEEEPVANPFDSAPHQEIELDDENKFLLGDAVAGDHCIKIPMGYFQVGDNYSQAITTTFTKSQSGVVTAISEVVGDATEGATEYFDLQGRKITNPAGGVYLMRRGTKVSKVLLR